METIFFPRNDYPNNVEVCKHRFGKKLTFTEASTSFPPLVVQYLFPYIVELNRTRKIRIAAFIDNRDNLVDEFYKQIDNNVVYPELYFLTKYVSGQYDYSDAAQEENKQILWAWFQNMFGRKPLAIMFGLMPGPYGDYMRRYILSGDSNSISSNTDYGVGVGSPNNMPYSHSGNTGEDYYFHRYWNTRVLDLSENDQDYASRITQFSSFIDQTMALPNGGWIYSFNHWHRLLALDIDFTTGEPKPGHEDLPAVNNGFIPYFDMLAEKNANDEIYFSGHGEAVSYLIYRDSISKIAMYSPVKNENDTIKIRLEVKNTYIDDSLLDLMQTPISIKFSTVGTPLENLPIESEQNLIELGNNQYIVEIPYSDYPEAIITKNFINF